MLSYDCGLCSVQCAAMQCATVQLVLLCNVQLCKCPACPMAMCKKHALPWLLSINFTKKKKNWINSRLLILIFEKIKNGRRLPLVCPRPTLPFFNFEFTVNWSKSIEKDFKLDCIYRKRSKIKMKKGKVRI